MEEKATENSEAYITWTGSILPTGEDMHYGGIKMSERGSQAKAKYTGNCGYFKRDWNNDSQHTIADRKGMISR